MDLRERMTTAIFPNNDDIRPIVRELIARIQACGRDFPIKVTSPLIPSVCTHGMVCAGKRW